MVMDMVWEEVTDDEGDSMPSKSDIGALKPTTSITKENNKNFAENKKEGNAAAATEGKPKPAAKKEKPAAVGQKSVMSFFKKS